MNSKTLLMLGITASLMACGGSKKKQPIEANEAKQITEQASSNFTIDTESSVINWAGHKVGGSHHGTLCLKSGNLAIEDDKLLSGSFVIDMNTIVNMDLTDAKMNQQLVDHLKSSDFFDVQKYPEAKFEITQTTKLENNRYQIDGNLTLKDITKNISLYAKINKDHEDRYTAITDTFAIDRTQWGVNYGSKNIFKDLKDAIINDAMDIQIVINSKIKE